MWLLPSIRPHLIERVFSIAPPSLPGRVLVEAGEAAQYAGVKLPSGWSLHVLQAAPYFCDKVNQFFAHAPAEPFYGILADDMVPETPGWDVTLAERAGHNRIAGSFQVHFDNHIGAGAIGGDLARTLGWLCLPAVKHFYSDAALELIGTEFKCLTVHKDVRIAHHHFAVGLAERDSSYNRRGDSNEDGRAYRQWYDRDWPALRDKLRPLYQ